MAVSHLRNGKQKTQNTAHEFPPPSKLPAPLNKLPLTFIRTRTSSVTTAWGVSWDEVLIARDIMQNFFDANRERLADVVVKDNGADVLITAPNTFNLNRLFFLGSEKDSDTNVGQYGEGFKAAATCLLRDHHVEIIAASECDVVCIRIADRAVEETKLFPMEYDFFARPTPIAGTLLLLRGCSTKLASELQKGLNHFFHDQNPVIGKKLWQSYGDSHSLYESTDGKGHIFYRNLKRAEFAEIPIVLVIKNKYVAVEKRIGKDRDRNAFGGEIMRHCFEVFARGARQSQNLEAVQMILERGRHCWERGHALIAELARGMAWQKLSASAIKELFGDRYFAEATPPQHWERDVEWGDRIGELEKEWKAAGKIRLPAYFEEFGLSTVRDHLNKLHQKVVAEAMQYKSPPSPGEAESIQLLGVILQELSSEIAAIFATRNTTYTVAKTEFLLGELRKSRNYQSIEVFLSSEVFLMDFPEAISIFLHEHAHIFGNDGSRAFADAVTRLLEATIRSRKTIDSHEAKWNVLRRAVVKERKTAKPVPANDAAWLASQTADQLRALIQGMPPHVIRKFKARHALSALSIKSHRALIAPEDEEDFEDDEDDEEG